MTPGTLPGEYFLQDVREMASGIRLKPDMTFQFFFSYGALDRYATGTWSVVQDKVSFNSKPWPGYDFTLTQKTNIQQDFTSITIDAGNPVIASYCYCGLNDDDQQDWKAINQRGELVIPWREVSRLHLGCEFVPERYTTIPITDTLCNDFSVKIESWLFEYFFKGFELKAGESELKGGHPFLKGNEWLYRR